MTGLVLPQPGNQITLNQEWSAHWAPDLKDKGLREAIFASPRFAERIAAQLFGAKASDPVDPELMQKTAGMLLEYAAPEKLRQLGMMWLAPRLVLSLMDGQSRLQCGPLEMDEIDEIFAQSEHVDLALLPNRVDQDMYAPQGLKCLLSWIKTLPPAVAGRIFTQLPRAALKKLDHVEARASLFLKVSIDLSEEQD